MSKIKPLRFFYTLVFYMVSRFPRLCIDKTKLRREFNAVFREFLHETIRQEEGQRKGQNIGQGRTDEQYRQIHRPPTKQRQWNLKAHDTHDFHP